MYRKELRKLRSGMRFSLWAMAAISIPFALLAIRFTHWLDDQIGWTWLDFGPQGAQAMLQTTVTACLSFLVFTFGSLLVAIQVASGQMTPRIIATILLRNNVIRATVGLFMFTLLFGIGVQNRLEGQVNHLPLFIASVLCVTCFAVFLFLIDYASRLLRPISILTHVATDGLAVIESDYPQPSEGPANVAHVARLSPPPDRVVEHQGTSAIVLAVDTERAKREAKRLGGVIEFAPQVGDFVGGDEPLFYLDDVAKNADEAVLRSCVIFGSERTMEQDPTFAFRIVVDIALKALSPAINDPTTAVLAVDQLHRMLRSVGRRHLRTDEMADENGDLRVILRTPNWEDFVHLALSEIRMCGASNMQIARRLRAMIENLEQTLPDHRHAALRLQLQLLDRDLERVYPNREDLELARIADPQGLGGSSGKSASPVGVHRAA